MPPTATSHFSTKSFISVGHADFTNTASAPSALPPSAPGRRRGPRTRPPASAARTACNRRACRRAACRSSGPRRGATGSARRQAPAARNSNDHAIAHHRIDMKASPSESARGNLPRPSLILARRFAALLCVGLFACAHAGAACPPGTSTKAALLVLKQVEWKVADDGARQALAIALLDCLAAPDPVLRDEIAFDALSTWARGRALTPATRRRSARRSCRASRRPAPTAPASPSRSRRSRSPRSRAPIASSRFSPTTSAPASCAPPPPT